MNVDLIENILTNSNVKGAPRMVLVALSFLAGADRVADVTLDQIRKAAGTTAVTGPLRKLEELGAITVGVHQGRMTPKGRANRYFIRRWGDQSITPEAEETDAGVSDRSGNLLNKYIDLQLEILEKQKRSPDQMITPEYLFDRLIRGGFYLDRGAVDLTARMITRHGTPIVKKAIDIAEQNQILTMGYVNGVAKNLAKYKPNDKLPTPADRPDLVDGESRPYIVTGEQDADVTPIQQYIQTLLESNDGTRRDGDSFHPSAVFEELASSDISSRDEAQAIDAVNHWWRLMGLVGVDRVMEQLLGVKVVYRRWQDLYLTFHITQEYW